MRRILGATLVALAFVAVTGLPVGAAEPPNAILNGKALAVAAQDLLYVNPNFDVYPVYSFSRNDNLSSYDLSGGVWPGFLLDAFMDFYGFGKPERSALGIVETQYPGVIGSGRGGTSDYGRENLSTACAFLFGPNGPAASAEALAACNVYVQTMIDDKSSKQLSARGQSDYLTSDGAATFSHAVLAAGVTAEHVVAASATNALKGVQESAASLLIQGLQIGDLRIGSLRATAKASAGKEGKSGLSELVLADATFAGQKTEITDQGVFVVVNGYLKPVNDQLAAQGFDVRLSQGRTYDDGPARVAESGGLVVRMRRDSLPEQLVSAQDTMCRTFAGPPFSEIPEVTRVKEDYPNPLYGVIPFVPMPQSVEVDEPIPPVVPCVYPNIAYDIGILIGTAQASAQFTPLPPVTPPPPVSGSSTQPRIVIDTYTVPGTPVIGPAQPATAPNPVASGPRHRRVAIPVLTVAVVARIKLVYGILGLLLLAILAGRFVLRALAAP